MKVNKRQIVFLSLALVVCVAVFLNWKFLNQIEGEGEGSLIIDSTETSADQEAEGDKTLGQAQLVGTSATNISEYFAECRLSKQQSRDEALELLKSVSDSNESSAETRDKANNDMISLAQTTDVESTIESLVKAKGFSECMAYIGDESVNVIVATSGLTTEGAAQINEIVIAETGRDASAVKIVEIKTE